MSNKWSWIGFLATVSALILAVIFFLATQQPTRRDWVVLAIGGTIGALMSGCAATFIFHAHPRTNKSTNSKEQSADTQLLAKTVSISVPGVTRHSGLNAHLNMMTNSHRVEWASNKKTVGALNPGKAGRWDVYYGDWSPRESSYEGGQFLGSADSVQHGIEMLKAKAISET